MLGDNSTGDQAASRATLTSWGHPGSSLADMGAPEGRAGTHWGHDVSDGSPDEEYGRPQRALQVFLWGCRRCIHQLFIQGEQRVLPVRPCLGIGPGHLGGREPAPQSGHLATSPPQQPQQSRQPTPCTPGLGLF